MADCAACGDRIHCPKGCYMLCTVECDDCSGGCEPRTVVSPMRFTAAERADRMATQVRFCGQGLEPESLREALASLLDLALAHDDAGRSGPIDLAHVGSVAELLAAAGLHEAKAA